MISKRFWTLLVLSGLIMLSSKLSAGIVGDFYLELTQDKYCQLVTAETESGNTDAEEEEEEPDCE